MNIYNERIKLLKINKIVFNNLYFFQEKKLIIRYKNIDIIRNIEININDFNINYFSELYFKYKNENKIKEFGYLLSNCLYEICCDFYGNNFYENIDNWINIIRNDKIGNSIYLPIIINNKEHSFSYYFYKVIENELKNSGNIGVNLEGKIESIIKQKPSFFLNYNKEKNNSLLNELLLYPEEIFDKEDKNIINDKEEKINDYKGKIYELFKNSIKRKNDKIILIYNEILDEFKMNNNLEGSLSSTSSEASISSDKEELPVMSSTYNKDGVKVKLDVQQSNEISFSLEEDNEKEKEKKTIVLTSNKIKDIKNKINDKYKSFYEKSNIEGFYKNKSKEFIFKKIEKKLSENNKDEAYELLEIYCVKKYEWNWYDNIKCWKELYSDKFKEILCYSTNKEYLPSNFKHIIFRYILNEISKNKLKDLIKDILKKYPDFFFCEYEKDKNINYLINSITELFDND